MTATFFKAVRPDGGSFHDPTFRWLPEDGVIPEGGWLVEHPEPAGRIGKSSGASASDYLSVATVPTDCTGFQWPCRLLEVEPVGRAFLDDFYASKRRVRAARVLRELDPHLALGPQGEQVAALIERVGRLTLDEKRRLVAARGAARGAAWGTARVAAWGAARGAARAAALGTARDVALDVARVAAWGAAWGAALGLVTRDLISSADYDTLTRPWASVIGKVHPDD